MIVPVIGIIDTSQLVFGLIILIALTRPGIFRLVLDQLAITFKKLAGFASGFIPLAKKLSTAAVDSLKKIGPLLPTITKIVFWVTIIFFITLGGLYGIGIVSRLVAAVVGLIAYFESGLGDNFDISGGFDGGLSEGELPTAEEAGKTGLAALFGPLGIFLKKFRERDK